MESFKLKGNVWYEYEQYNASVPILFLVGTGKDKMSAIKNLIESFNIYVDKLVETSFDNKITDDSFILKFKNYEKFLYENYRIQQSTYKIKNEAISIFTLNDYLKEIEVFVPEAKKLIENSIPN